MWEPHPYDQDPHEPADAGPPEPLWAQPEPGGLAVDAPPAPLPRLPTAGSQPLLTAEVSTAVETPVVIQPALIEPAPIPAAGIQPTRAATPVQPGLPSRLASQPPRTVLRRLSELSAAPLRIGRSAGPEPASPTQPPDAGRMERLLAGLEQQISTPPRAPVNVSPGLPNLMERIRAARLRAERVRTEPVASAPVVATPTGPARFAEPPVPEAPVVPEVPVVPEALVVPEVPVVPEAPVAEVPVAEVPLADALAGEPVSTAMEPLAIAMEPVPTARESAEPTLAPPTRRDADSTGELPVPELESAAEPPAPVFLLGAPLQFNLTEPQVDARVFAAPTPDELEPPRSAFVQQPPVPAAPSGGRELRLDPFGDGLDLPLPVFLAPPAAIAPAASAPAESGVDVAAKGAANAPAEEPAIPEDLIPPLPPILAASLSGSAETMMSALGPPAPRATEGKAARRHLESLVGALDAEISEGLAQLSAGVESTRGPQGLSSTSRDRFAAANAQRFVVFHMGGSRYGLPIGEVLEMANVPRTTPLPNAPDFIRGVANLRGEVLAVIDLRALLALESTATDLLRERMIVVRSPQSEAVAGLIVDSVRGLARLGAGQIVQPSSPVEDRVADFLQGVASHEDQVLNVLDTRKLFAAPEIVSLASV